MRLDRLLIGYTTPLCPPIDTTLEAGRLTCLVGRNGVGKSTLMRTLAGLERPLGGAVVAGDVRLDARHRMVSSPRLLAALARCVAVVLTDVPRLYGTTVADLVALGRMPHVVASPLTAMSRPKTSLTERAIVRQAMTDAGIAHLADRRLATLSDGERQKAMLARALAQQTDYILLDEPTAFLDHPSRLDLYAQLHRLAHDGGKTILLSTHDLELAHREADMFWELSAQGLTTKHNDNRQANN